MNKNKRIVLIVCNGNIHRSVVAEHCINLMLRSFDKDKEIIAMSRGLRGTMGSVVPKHRRMCEYDLEWSLTRPVLEDLGIDVDVFYTHINTPITIADVDRSSLILAMDRLVLSGLPNSLMRQFPQHQKKMRLFLELIGKQEDIPDCGGSPDAELHRQVNQLIQRTAVQGINVLLDWISSTEGGK